MYYNDKNIQTDEQDDEEKDTKGRYIDNDKGKKKGKYTIQDCIEKFTEREQLVRRSAC